MVQTTLADAIAHLPSHGRVFVHGAAATPNALIGELVVQAARFDELELIHIHTHGDAAYADDAWSKNFRITNLFVGENMRRRLDGERIDYLPCFLSEIPNLFRSGSRRLDAALVSLSPPDAHGFCTLGTSVDIAQAAIETAPIIIAQVNRRMPRVHGSGSIHISRVTAWVEVDESLHGCDPEPTDDVHARIAHHVAGIVEDGATLQLGIGAIPDAVLKALRHHRHLGLHTEMFSDGAVDLMQVGAIDNSQKRVFRGFSAASFVVGSDRLYRHIDDNPSIALYDATTINNPRLISKNPKVTAVNSAVEIDLTGQVCADSIGTKIISGVGGQMDFIRAASLSEHGRPIIALPSRTRRGESRIVPVLKSGAGVVTTRAHVHWVATEWGIANLYGRTLGERARLLIGLAHPDDREMLGRAWHERNGRG
jgi:4-hydroxybutyrate CoA-transferase